MAVFSSHRVHYATIVAHFKITRMSGIDVWTREQAGRRAGGLFRRNRVLDLSPTGTPRGAGRRHRVRSCVRHADRLCRKAIIRLSP